MAELSYEERRKTCDKCNHEYRLDIAGSPCYLCKRNPEDHRFDYWEERNKNSNLIALLQNSNNPVRWIFMNNEQFSELAEYLANNGVVVKEKEE